MATAAEVIAGFLARAGVRRIYGVPAGDSTLEVIEACRQRGIEFLLTHHEASAALMAATEGDLLGRPGICLAGLGPGVASATAGVAYAYLDRTPLLLFSGCPSRRTLRLAPREVLDHSRLVEAIVKDTATVTASRAERLLHWAWTKALAVPRGPVHLEIPADEASRPTHRSGHPPDRDCLPGPSPSAIRTAARLLTPRRRVIVLAGLGCRSMGPARALQDLVEHLGSPVLTTYRAKGVIPEDHSLVAGIFAGDRLERELLSKADGILAVGLDSSEVMWRPWRGSLPVVVLADHPTIPRPYEPSSEVIADLPLALDALREALPPGGGWDLAAWAGQGGNFKSRARALLAEASSGRGQKWVPPHRVVEIARAVFPRETVAAMDSGAHALAVAAFWDCYEPKGCLCSSSLAAPGYALPAAIAAKLTLPDRPVLAFLGDGGFLRSIADLATAVWRRVPLIAVVFTDASLCLSRIQQEQKRYAPEGVSLGMMEIPKLAESLGAFGTEVEDEESLRSALKDAMGTSLPAVISVRIRPTGYRRMLEILRGKIGER